MAASRSIPTLFVDRSNFAGILGWADRSMIAKGDRADLLMLTKVHEMMQSSAAVRLEGAASALS